MRSTRSQRHGRVAGLLHGDVLNSKRPIIDLADDALPKHFLAVAVLRCPCAFSLHLALFLVVEEVLREVLACIADGFGPHHFLVHSFL